MPSTVFSKGLKEVIFWRSCQNYAGKFRMEREFPNPAVHSNNFSYIFADIGNFSTQPKMHRIVCDIGVRGNYFKIKPGTLFIPSDSIRLSRGLEREEHKDHANNAKAHADQGGDAHKARPERGLSLRYKIGLVVLVFTLLQLGFYACFRKASDELTGGDATAGIAYLLLSVFGVMLSVVGGFLLISSLIEQAYAY